MNWDKYFNTRKQLVETARRYGRYADFTLRFPELHGQPATPRTMGAQISEIKALLLDVMVEANEVQLAQKQGNGSWR